MKSRFQFGLAITLGCLVIAIETVVLLSLGTFYLRRFSTEVDRRLEDSLKKPSALVAQGALSTDAFGQKDTLESVVGPALDDAMVVSADGIILVAIKPEKVGRRWNDFSEVKSSWLQRAATGGFNEHFQSGPNSYLVRVAPVASAGGEAPVLFSYVRISTTENERELTNLRIRLIGGSAAATIVTTVALLLGVHFLVTRRLRRVADGVEQVTTGNYYTSLGEVHLRDEIGFLKTGFNTMTERLRHGFDGLHNAVRDLEIAEQKYRVLVENADESIAVVQDGKFAFVNAKAYEMLSDRTHTLVGRSILEFIHVDDRTMVADRYAKRTRGEPAPPRYEFRMIATGGKNIWVEINSVLIDWKGAAATLNFVRDITQRKFAETEREKLQIQLTQAQKMESIGRLAGGVAHDFNNMLQVILGNASLALMELPPGSPLSENIAEIEKAARRSAELTRQLLTFARKQAITPRALDLNQVIAGMLKLLGRLIGENITLNWLPSSNLWSVNIDPSQVDQIMANLCVNARDVITGAGRISIETRNVTLDNTYSVSHPDCVPGDYVQLSVSDSGHGMDGETLAHIFEPFFTTKEIGHGTGLGLATVFGIVKQNRGLINVYSEPKQGTTFKLYFPRGEDLIATSIETAHEVATWTETVLLVEDEELILMLGKSILAQHGYNVLTASLPETALQISEQHEGPIHLLITDVVMPGMNGKELRERLKVTRKETKFLFMSGYTADIIGHHGVLDEGVEFIQKPFTIQSLTEKVRMVLLQDPKKAPGGK